MSFIFLVLLAKNLESILLTNKIDTQKLLILKKIATNCMFLIFLLSIYKFLVSSSK